MNDVISDYRVNFYSFQRLFTRLHLKFALKAKTLGPRLQLMQVLYRRDFSVKNSLFMNLILRRAIHEDGFLYADQIAYDQKMQDACRLILAISNIASYVSVNRLMQFVHEGIFLLSADAATTNRH
jgi:hypothetical protein